MVHVDETGKSIFVFRHATADQVFLVGDFCHWQADHLPMRRVSDHEWMLMLRLPPGTYEFRYFAGGRWYTDYAAFGLTQNAFRDYNSVLRIPKVRPVNLEPIRARWRDSIRMAASA
jgi:hypothetical protein